MTAAFPRIPHIGSESKAARGDKVADAETRRSLLTEPVIVEEKVDGANVSIRFQGPDLVIGTRGGTDTIDRGGVKPRVRAWAWRNHDALRALLAPDEVLYGEWMGTRMGVDYAALPDDLLVLDLWHPRRGFTTVDDRSQRCAEVGLSIPPRVFQGRLGSISALMALHGPSPLGTASPEGLVIRLERGGRLVTIAKWVSPAYRRPDL